MPRSSAVALVVVSSRLVVGVPDAGAAAGGTPDIVTTCTEAALSAAIAQATVIDFGCSGRLLSRGL